MDAAYFRGELAKRRLRRYEVAAAVRINPARFSQILNDRLPMSSDVASRIQAYLAHFDAGRQEVGCGR